MNFTKLIFAYLLALTLCFLPLKQSLAISEGTPSQWLPAVSNNGLGQIGNTAYNVPVSGAPKDIRAIAANLINVLLGLLGTVFIILIIAAGFIWMTAAGNPEKVKKAINLMAMGAIGLLIIIAAFAISLYVTSRTIYSVESSINQSPDPNIKTNNNNLY